MTDHEAILRAICEYPREDTPRLAYADWLDENADMSPLPERVHERARFIRADVTAYALPEWDPDRAVYDFVSRQLKEQPWSEIELSPLPLGLMWLGSPPIRRGFPWALQVVEEGYPLSRLGEAVLRYPVERLEFFHSPANLRQLAVAEWLPKLSGIRFSAGGYVFPALAEFLNSLWLGGLEELLFWSGALSADGADMLVRSLAFGRITSLAIVDSQMTVPDFLSAVTRHANPGQLRNLDLRNNRLGYPALFYALARQLVDGPLLGRLFRLNLANNELHATHIQPLTESPAVSNLKVLILRGNPLGDAGATTLASSPYFGELKVLDLSYCLVGDGGFAALMDSFFADGLVFLNLAGSPASPASKSAIKERMGNRVRV
jgi:uncharacterized protein (TIGR02996 family)